MNKSCSFPKYTASIAFSSMQPVALFGTIFLSIFILLILHSKPSQLTFSSHQPLPLIIQTKMQQFLLSETSFSHKLALWA